ncbi:hypothetical protein CDAR_614151 [Caerostris darwini]|uniref:Uncharacterized protein n=1 Tax=Caerostris darwini TaxID=1538125 RepID=A0AAV4WE64_9ARAC|nr:hypothetical protein CDAR_614151 [Caerostris darwini]
MISVLTGSGLIVKAYMQYDRIGGKKHLPLTPDIECGLTGKKRDVLPSFCKPRVSPLTSATPYIYICVYTPRPPTPLSQIRFLGVARVE